MSDTRKSQFSQKILFHVSPVIHIKSISIAHKNVMIMNISSMCLIGMNESELGIMPVNPIVLPFFFKNSSQPRTLSPSLSLNRFLSNLFWREDSAYRYTLSSRYPKIVFMTLGKVRRPLQADHRKKILYHLSFRACTAMQNCISIKIE